MADADADALLVERVKRGDVRAFEMLVVKYQRRIERLIGRMVRDVDLVQDIAQESFIRAYRALPQFRGESAFYTWLYRIAVNTAKKSLMDMKRDPLVLESSRSLGEDGEETSRAENELTDGETPEALLASKEIATAVNTAIEALSEDLRQAITPARDRRPQLRRDCRSHELPHRYRTLAHLPRPRSHRHQAASAAGHTRRGTLVAIRFKASCPAHRPRSSEPVA